MPRNSRLVLLLLLLLAAIALSACGKGAAGGGGEEDEGEETHAKVEDIPGSDSKRIVLTGVAANALGVRTGVVREVRENDGGRALEVPYAAVFYDAEGKSYTYTSPAPLTYVRKRIVIDDVRDRKAFLTKGPRPGTTVVTVGADELLGVEEGVQE
jgi:hypothetical protein